MKIYFNNPRYYIEPLFDPIQTHAVYGVNNDADSIHDVKETLKKHGATRFRVVKNRYGKAIICFKEAKKDLTK